MSNTTDYYVIQKCSFNEREFEDVSKFWTLEGVKWDLDRLSKLNWKDGVEFRVLRRTDEQIQAFNTTIFPTRNEP